jgi:hypothetical protein
LQAAQEKNYHFALAKRHCNEITMHRQIGRNKMTDLGSILGVGSPNVNATSNQAITEQF